MTKETELVFDQIIIDNKVYYLHSSGTIWDENATIVGYTQDLHTDNPIYILFVNMKKFQKKTLNL